MKNKFNVLAIVGFIFSCTVLFSLIGFILCLIATVQISRRKERGLGLAIAGAIIGFLLPLILGIIFAFGIFAFYNFSTVLGSGNVVSQNYDLTEFDSIDISEGAELILTQGTEQSVLIEAEDNILESLEIGVEERTLEVVSDETLWLKKTKPILVYVTVPEIKELAVVGSGEIRSTTPIVSRDLELEVFGSGDIDLEVQTTTLSTKIIGSGDIFVNGTTEEYFPTIHGSGAVNSLGLTAKEVTAEILGSGDMNLHASETLDITIEGSGDVIYKGSPQVSQAIEGSGSVRPI